LWWEKVKEIDRKGSCKVEVEVEVEVKVKNDDSGRTEETWREAM
jgi:hypothetical protein